MHDLTLALAQVDQIWEDKTANLAHFEQLLQPISGVDLLLLPELFHTGFTMNGEALAEPMDDSLALDWLRKTAKEKNTAIYTSFIAAENGHHYNRGVFVEPSGVIHCYDKRKTFGLAGESAVYTAGNQAQLVHYKGWKIQLQICYDLRFPEISRNYLEADGTPHYDMLLYVANWPEKRAVHWRALLQARAIENQAYVVGLNRVRIDGKGLVYSGGSVLFNALGEEELSFEKDEENIKLVTVSKDKLAEIRSNLPFLIDSDYRLFNR